VLPSGQEIDTREYTTMELANIMNRGDNINDIDLKEKILKAIRAGHFLRK